MSVRSPVCMYGLMSAMQEHDNSTDNLTFVSLVRQLTTLNTETVSKPLSNLMWFALLYQAYRSHQIVMLLSCHCSVFYPFQVHTNDRSLGMCTCSK